MSKGYRGHGILSTSWVERTISWGGNLFLCMVAFLCLWGVQHLIARDNRITQETAASRFHAGDIVRAKIGGFRGFVKYVHCDSGCTYLVRFNMASMEPQRVNESEIEAEK